MLSADYVRVDVIKHASTLACRTEDERAAACLAFADDFNILSAAVSTSAGLYNLKKMKITFHIQVNLAGAPYTDKYGNSGNLGPSASHSASHPGKPFFTNNSRIAVFMCNQPGATVGWRYLAGVATSPPAFRAEPLGKPIDASDPGVITPPVASASPSTSATSFATPMRNGWRKLPPCLR
jgi:hypothetical protein